MSRYGFGLDEANKTGKPLRGEKKRKKHGRKKMERKMKGRE